jgi:hypothetical protein
MLLDPPPIHEKPVPAAHIFQHVTRSIENDLRVLPRRTPVTQNKVVLLMPADAEGHRLKRHLQMVPTWLDDD